MRPPNDRKSSWDDEDDWGRPPRRVNPADLPPVKPWRRGNVVTWMYVVAAVLIAAQIAYFYLSR